MRGIIISDLQDGVLAFDLVDILRLLGPEGLQSNWIVRRGVEAIGDAADRLEKLSEENGRIAGTDLMEVASHIIQVIDGTFEGYRKGAVTPWIIIRAVDSTSYDILSDDEEVLKAVKNRYKKVVDYPSGGDVPIAVEN
jgi:hypothetical protein